MFREISVDSELAELERDCFDRHGYVGLRMGYSIRNARKGLLPTARFYADLGTEEQGLATENGAKHLQASCVLMVQATPDEETVALLASTPQAAQTLVLTHLRNFSALGIANPANPSQPRRAVTFSAVDDRMFGDHIRTLVAEIGFEIKCQLSDVAC